MSDRDKLIQQEIEQSDLTRNDDLPEGSVGVRKNAVSTVFTLRLPNESVRELEDLARQSDVPTSALARGFILDGIADSKRATVQSRLDHIATELRRLRGMIA
jgi:predicted transcriptional regulator